MDPKIDEYGDPISDACYLENHQKCISTVCHCHCHDQIVNKPLQNSKSQFDDGEN